MRRLFWLAMIGLAAPLAVNAQTTANPVVSTARELFARQSKFIVAAAEEMPADKYSYHPTADQWSFGKVTSHVALSSNAVCAMLSDSPAPPGAKVSDTDPKDTIVVAVKASFEFCDKALANLNDSQMGDTITFFRGAKASRARALFELTGDLEDHYSQMAGYLRLNGLTPPSAQPKK
jgi:DinB superfamily